jgi:hypothetical protein
MIEAVPDVQTRQCLSFLVTKQQTQHDSVVTSYKHIEQLLSALGIDLKETRSEMRSIRELMPPPHPSSPLYPQFIAAASSDSKSSSSPTLHGSSSSSSSGASHPATGLSLPCLFCPKVHRSEKSHCQHMARLSHRIEFGDFYSGQCVIPVDHWIYLTYPGDPSQSVPVFVSQYLSHLASSNQKDVDYGRREELMMWLNGLRKE